MSINNKLIPWTVIVLTIIATNLHFIDGSITSPRSIDTNGTAGVVTTNASNVNGYRRNSAASASMQSSQSSRERDNKLMSLLAVRRTALTSSSSAAPQPSGYNSNNSSSSSINNNNNSNNSRWRSRVYNNHNQNLDCAKNCTNNFTVRLSAECIRRCSPMNRNRTNNNNTNRDKERDSQNVSVSSSISVSTSSKSKSSSNINNSNNNGITHHPKIDELNSIRDELLDMDESSHVLVVNTKSNNDKYPSSIVMHGTKDLSSTNNLYEAEDLKTEFKLLPPSIIGGGPVDHHRSHHAHHHGSAAAAGIFNRTSKYTNIIRSRHKAANSASTTSERTTLEESDLIPYFYFGQKLTPTSRHSSPSRNSASTSTTSEKPTLVGSSSNNKFWMANRNQPTSNRNINIVAFNNAQRRAQSAIVSPVVTPTTLRPYSTTTVELATTKRPSTTTPSTTTTTTTTVAPPVTPTNSTVKKLIENITSVNVPHPLEINHNLGLLGADDKNDEKRLEQPAIGDIFNLTETTERIPVFRIEVTDATNSPEEVVAATEITPMKDVQIVGVENDDDETIVFVSNSTASTTSTTTTTTVEPVTTVLTIAATEPNAVDEIDAVDQRTFAPVPDLSDLFPNISPDNHTGLALNTTSAPVAEVRTIISSMSSNSSTVQPTNLTSTTTTTTTTTTPSTEPQTTGTTSTSTSTAVPTTVAATTIKITTMTTIRPIMKFRTISNTSTPLPITSNAGLNTSLIFPPFLTLPNKDANFTKPKPPIHILNDNGEPLNNTNNVTVEIHRMNMATYVLAGLGMFPIVVILMYVIKTVVFKKKPKVTEDLDRYIQDGQPISPVVRLEQSDTSSIAGDSIVTDRDFDRNKIRFKSLLGEGNFGQVWKAEVDDLAGHLGTTRIVAVKAERSGNRQSGLKEEAEIMRKLGSHSNVVTLLGACIEQEPHLLIMEFAMRGRLLSLLRAARNTVSSMTGGTVNCRNIINPLSPRQLAGFSHDIARGMEYIADKKIVHRDLAARNILLDHNGICKICDFGMSIDLEKSKPTQPQTRKADFINRQNSHHSPESRFRFDHHHSGPTRFMSNVLNFDRCGKSAAINTNNNNANTMGRVRPALPIRWMAPEALQYHIFSIESDVWAFGIVMWEIVTLGCTPYPNLSGREVVRNIPHGTRPEIPVSCRPELADLMQRTWRKDPRHRPTFTEARAELGQYFRLWETDENDCTSDYLDVSGFSEDVEHGMVYLNRRISEFECEI